MAGPPVADKPSPRSRKRQNCRKEKYKLKKVSVAEQHLPKMANLVLFL